jgi:hypothetical protein
MKKRAPSGVPPRPGTANVIVFRSSDSRVRPLKARTKEGKLYSRFEEVERQIERLLQAPAHMWPSLVREGIEGQSVKNESIVYLAREAWHRGHDDELLQLHSLLFDRMATTALNRAGKMGLFDAAPLIEALQNRIIELLYGGSGTAATDFLEVAFNRVVSCEIQKWSRKHGKYWQRLDIDAAIPDESVVEHSTILSAATIERIEAGLSTEIIVQNARKWLASPHFDAFYLHYVKGIPVEPKAGSQASLVGHFGRPASTIYFWLERAIEIIRDKLSTRPEA